MEITKRLTLESRVEGSLTGLKIGNTPRFWGDTRHKKAVSPAIRVVAHRFGKVSTITVKASPSAIYRSSCFWKDSPCIA